MTDNVTTSEALGLALPMVGLAAWYARRWWYSREGRGWSAGPRIRGKHYSPKIDLDKEPGTLCAFDFHEIHYLTRAVKRIGPQLHIVFEIEADEGTVFYDTEKMAPSAKITAYFQRKGDDWSGDGDKQYYRWWAGSHRIPVTPGRHEITIPVNAEWTSVFGQKSPEHFAKALQNVGRAGITFGGHFFGHGAHAIGNARFRLLKFEGVS